MIIPKAAAMHNYARINSEITRFPQWVNWKYEDKGGAKPTKVPYSSHTGELASVINPFTWVDFNAAVSAVRGFDGIGFVFTDNDPFCGVDLDYTTDPQQNANQVKVYNALNSYSERSPSGNGLHIITKASIPSGRKRSAIELYSSHRYLTFTGDIFEPIRNIEYRQEVISALWAELSPGALKSFTVVSEPERFPDHELIMKASAAHNGDFFKDLWSGNWQTHYPSQSEADYALIDILQFWSPNTQQIERLFLQSELGKRPKAKRRDYIESMINRSFDRSAPPIDLAHFQADIDRIFSELKNTTPPTVSTIEGAVAVAASPMPGGAPSARIEAHDSEREYVVKPPGLLGRAADFFLAAAHRPIPEAALAAAIGLMAGMCGRAYNTPTGAGLNLYTCLVAKTAVGKELMSSGISKLITRVERSECPSVAKFLGPSELRSDAALLRTLESQPSCVSFMGEFGIKLAAMCSPAASTHLTGLRSVLLDLYGKSGEGNVLRPMAYSQTEKNTKSIYCPAFSILAESTPETLYPNLDEIIIAQGLLPRFMIIEYTGDRPPANEGAAFCEPSPELVREFITLTVQCLENEQKLTIKKCIFTAEALDLARAFDRFCDDQIVGNDKDVVRNLWSRAHLKAMKLASLLSIGVNMHVPTIDGLMWTWAQNLIERDVRNVIKRFSSDQVGGFTGHGNQETEVLRVVSDYYKKSYPDVHVYMNGLYKISEKMHNDRVIPYAYIQRRLVNVGSFRNDKIGATNAIKRAVQNLVDSGSLQELDKRNILTKYNMNFRGFVLSI